MKALYTTLLLFVATAHSVSASESVSRLVFGSCAEQSKKQEIWRAIQKEKPDVMIMLGDNIYADTEDMDAMRRGYELLAANKGFESVRKSTQLVATWDDHDFGANDIGSEYPMKHESRANFLEFFDVAKDSPRWTQEGGIYTSYYWGEEGSRVQLILLDTRWDRTPLSHVTKEQYAAERAPKQMGPYSPTTDEDAMMLGAAQWEWLEAELSRPADVRIIGSSIQVLSDFTGWEAWSNFPKERERLFRLLESTQANGVFLISGDTHWAEFSRLKLDTGYPLWELTSSGLTEEWKFVSPNKNRVGPFTYKANYGLIEIDWEAAKPQVTLSIKNEEGELVLRNTLLLEDLVFEGK